MKNNFNLGERVRYFRKLKGFSQEQLAFKADITPAYLGQIERNLKNPTVKILEKICDSLDVSLADFFDIEKESCEEKDIFSEQIYAQIRGKSTAEKKMLLKIIKQIIKYKDVG